MTNCCMNCDYCNKKRKNAIGMPRCKMHNMFVAPDDCCDLHCNKGVIERELWAKTKGAVDEDNLTQNQRGNSELNSELKPCPKCRGEIRIYVATFKGAVAKCMECKSLFDICGMDKIPLYDGVKIRKSTVRKVYKMWNRSAADEIQ